MNTMESQDVLQVKDSLLRPDFEGYQLILDNDQRTTTSKLPFELLQSWNIETAAKNTETAAAISTAAAASDASSDAKGKAVYDRVKDLPEHDRHVKKVLQDRYHANRLFSYNDQRKTSDQDQAVFVANSQTDIFVLDLHPQGKGVGDFKCIFQGKDFTHEYNRYHEDRIRTVVWPEEPTVAACRIDEQNSFYLVVADGKGEVNILLRDVVGGPAKDERTQGKCRVVGGFVNVLTDSITKIVQAKSQDVDNEKLRNVERGFPCRILDCSYDREKKTIHVALISCVDMDKFIQTTESVVTSGASQTLSHESVMQQARKRQEQIQFFVHTVELAYKDDVHLDPVEKWQVVRDNCVVGLQPVKDGWYEGLELVVLSEKPFASVPPEKDMIDDDVSLDDFRSNDEVMVDTPQREKTYVEQVNERLAPYTASLEEESYVDMVETDEDATAHQFYMTGVRFVSPDSDDLDVSILCSSYARQLLGTSRVHKSIGIRHGYDMCAFVRDARTGNFDHVATFHALGYVLESKQQKRFVRFDSEIGASFVVEHQDRIYIYLSQQVDEKTRKAPHQIITLDGGGQVLGFCTSGNHDFVVLKNDKLLHYRYNNAS